MTGYNLPPGCEVHHLPGNRPEDVAWDNYWESDRPEAIYNEVFNGPKITDTDIYSVYLINKAYKEAINRDFLEWMNGAVQ